MADAPPIDRVEVANYRFPTPTPESDGTLDWTATVAVVVQLHAGSHTGLGWTYSSPAAAVVVEHHLADLVCGADTFDITTGWEAQRRATRNLGTKGLVMQAISAVDIAWWDLKARLLGVPLVELFGRCRDRVPIYGSGGFTNFDDDQLAAQVAGWRQAGVPAMKIKIAERWGQDVERDLARVRQLRHWGGPDVALMVDANGGYTIGQAVRVGEQLDELGVIWFEEPVSSDNPVGLAHLRATLRCDIAAGEYASDRFDAIALLGAVDCLQLDVTRCGGYTGWLQAAAVAAASNLDVSGHCAPALHLPVAAAIGNLRHVEWFADHVRLESELVDGAPDAVNGALCPNRRPGHGMVLSARADRYRIS